MSGVLRFLRKLWGFPAGQDARLRSHDLFVKDLSRFAEGDRVLLDGTKLLALQKNQKSQTRHRRSGQTAAISHNDIIGKPSSSLYLRIEGDSVHKIEYPTLNQYVSLTPRLVTPVYATYAASIVSLLDFHVSPPVADDHQNVSQPKWEILEAGTGHGSLTLHLARALAAANQTPPSIQYPEIRSPSVEATESSKSALQIQLRKAWDDWRRKRNAVVHTVERYTANSIHAEKIVRGYRQGLYWPHIDFYVDDVSDWVNQHIQARNSRSTRQTNSDDQGFLSHVILDLPNVHTHLSGAHKGIKANGQLLVFTPSVTQIGECVKAIQQQNLPLVLDRVIELGEGISSGRRWDVRIVTPRQSKEPKIESQIEESQSDESIEENSTNPDDGIAEQLSSDQSSAEPVMVCRPKVGERTFGGGFIALWNKVAENPNADEALWRELKSAKLRKRN